MIDRPLPPKLWVLAYTSAVVGDVAYFVILTWAATEAGGAAWSGFVLAAGALPRALLLLVGGLLADRFDPRSIAIATDTLRALTMIAAAALSASAGLLPWWLVTVSLVFGIVDACFIPAVGAMPAQLVEPDELKRLQSWRLTGLRVANTAGPALGAVLLLAGSSVAFAAIAVLFAVSVALMWNVRNASAPAAAVRTTPAAPALRWGTLRKLRLPLLIVGTALSEIPFSGPVAVGIILLVHEHSWSPSAAGAILASFSAAGLGLSILLSLRGADRLGRRAVAAASAATAILLVCLGVSPTIPLSVLFGAALGMTTSLVMVVCHGQIQQSTPPALLGRVTAVVSLLTLGLAPIAYATAGVVTQIAGAGLLFTGAAAIVVVSGVALSSVRFQAPRNAE